MAARGRECSGPAWLISPLNVGLVVSQRKYRMLPLKKVGWRLGGDAHRRPHVGALCGGVLRTPAMPVSGLALCGVRAFAFSQGDMVGSPQHRAPLSEPWEKGKGTGRYPDTGKVLLEVQQSSHCTKPQQVRQSDDPGAPARCLRGGGRAPGASARWSSRRLLE